MKSPQSRVRTVLGTVATLLAVMLAGASLHLLGESSERPDHATKLHAAGGASIASAIALGYAGHRNLRAPTTRKETT